MHDLYASKRIFVSHGGPHDEKGRERHREKESEGVMGGGAVRESCAASVMAWHRVCTVATDDTATEAVPEEDLKPVRPTEVPSPVLMVCVTSTLGG